MSTAGRPEDDCRSARREGTPAPAAPERIRARAGACPAGVASRTHAPG